MTLSRLLKSSSLIALLGLTACSNDHAKNSGTDAGDAQGGNGGSSGASAGGAAGAAGSSGGTATGGSDASVPSAGRDGGLQEAGTDAHAPHGDSGSGTELMDAGSSGDGDFTIGPSYTIDPLNDFQGAPVGQQITFQMHGADSTIYPGRSGNYTRNVWVYIPAQYVAGTPAPFIVVQDGNYAVWFGSLVPHTPDTAQVNLPQTANLPRILDNLIAAGQLPKIVTVFAESGGGDGGNSERGLEYDTVSGVYADYVQTEVLPRVISEVKSQLNLDLAFTDDPNGRATLGGSSGGAASFSMGWWHPEYFRRILTYSGTFVRQASPENPMFPHGCWCYHDFDPYDPATPNGLIMQATENKPLRVWLESGENDMGAGGGPETYRNFKLANDRMAASFALKGYHYHYDYALGAGHLDGNVVAQTLPSALLWLWRGYPVN